MAWIATSVSPGLAGKRVRAVPLVRLYPLRAMCLLVIGLVWKAIWMVGYGLPQWSTGQQPPIFAEDFVNIATGAILLVTTRRVRGSEMRGAAIQARQK